MSLPLLALPIGDGLSYREEQRLRSLEGGVSRILFNQRLSAAKQDMPDGPEAASGAAGKWEARMVKQWNCFSCSKSGARREVVWAVSEEAGFGTDGKQYELWAKGEREALETSFACYVWIGVGLMLVVGTIVAVVVLGPSPDSA